MRFEVGFCGHPNVLSTHKKTIEITRETALTPRGDCIVGVGAESACADLPDELKSRLRDPGRPVRIAIEVGGLRFEAEGVGHKGLTLTHASDIVVRKSRFVCPRTLAVGSDKASDDVPRDMVRLLRDPGARGVFSIET